MTETQQSPAASTSKPRPARQQVTHARLEAIRTAVEEQKRGSGVYNVWYGNYSGGDFDDKYRDQGKSETRCDIARDSGYTKADLLLQSRTKAGLDASAGQNGVYCCLHFARGCCPNGADCTFLHRLPRPTDVMDQGRDVFGRSKFGQYRDDMGGVGSMQRVNKTLYVGRLREEPGWKDDLDSQVASGGNAQWRDGGRTVKGGKSTYDANRELRRDAKQKPRQHQESPTEKVLRRHFSEWGEIERLRVLHGRSCGFVTYKSEANAQFAKEAMFHQSLDHEEILNVRWATDDPNPGAQKRDLRELAAQGERAIAEQMTGEMMEAQSSLLALEDADREDSSAKRRRLDEEEMRRLEEENQRGWEEIERERQQAEAAEANANGSPDESATAAGGGGGGGLLDAGILGNLQALSAMRKTEAAAPANGSKAAAGGLSSLAAYGSDSEDD